MISCDGDCAGISGLKTKHAKVTTEYNLDFDGRTTWFRRGISDAETGSFSNILDSRTNTRRTFMNRLLLLLDETNPSAVMQTLLVGFEDIPECGVKPSSSGSISMPRN